MQVAFGTSVDDHAMSLACEEIAGQPLQALLAGRFRATAIGAGVDVHLDRQARDRVGKEAAARGPLPVEVQFSLAWKEKLTHGAAKLAQLGWVDEGGGDEVATVSCRLVYEGVDGHWAIMA